MYSIEEIKKMKFISFSDTDDNPIIYEKLPGSPGNYMDIARYGENLSQILIELTGDSNYYSEIAEFIKQCNDNISIKNKIFGSSSKEEFLKSEEIINSIIGQIDINWSDKQKAAFVHYEMGKLVSYMPDFNSNNYVGSKKAEDVRNVWKSISSGVSVCNGITDIQRSILSRIGIQTEELSSGIHSFMLVKLDEGNIITDATWDLENTLYDCMPMYFGKSYETLRKQEEGLSNAHKLQQQPENVIEISEQELREIYYSIGITNVDRKFKIPILSKVDEINSIGFNNKKEKVDAFLEMFMNSFSKEATHLCESRDMLKQCIKDLGIQEKDINMDFVYTKEDKECKKPILVLNIEDVEMKDKFKIMNLHENKFDKVNLEEFNQNYKLHNLKKENPFWKKQLQDKEKDNSSDKNKSVSPIGIENEK